MTAGSGRTVLDWSGSDGAPRATVGSTGDPKRDLKPCIHCGGLALLRHPVSKLPCHKICEEAALDAKAGRSGETA
jgi:hypothetical protein